MSFQRFPVSNYFFLLLLSLANFLISLGVCLLLVSIFDSLPEALILLISFFICFLVNSLLFSSLVNTFFHHVLIFGLFLVVLLLLLVNEFLFNTYLVNLSYGEQLKVFINYFLLSWLLVSIWSFRRNKNRVRNVFISSLTALLVLAIYQYFMGLLVLELAIFVCFLAAFLSEIDFKKRAFLRIINGSLAGHVFFVDKDVLLIGSDSSDDVYLKNYYGVKYSHVKIVSYTEPKSFFLLDNSFDALPRLNYRKIKEQVIENRDILIIGAAKLQFFAPK